MTLLRLALRDVLVDGRRSLLSIAALAPIVAAFLIQTGVASGLDDEQIAPDAQNILLVSSDALDPSAGKLDPSVLDVPATVGGVDVAAAGPVIFRAIRVDDVVVQLRAAPLDQWDRVHGLEVVDGECPVQDTDEIAVTEGISIATGWSRGDRVEIFGSTFEIVAVVRAPGTKFASVWMDFDRADRLFEGLTGFQMVTVRTASGVDSDDLVRRFEVAADGRYVVYYESVLSDEQSARGSAAVEISLMAVLIGGAALGFGTFNLVALSLAERRRDFAIARTIGMSRAALASFVVVRSLVVAGAAFVCGGVGAWLVMLTSETTTLRSVVFEVAIPARGWLLGAALTLLVTAIAAAAAAVSAGRQRIRDMLGSA